MPITAVIGAQWGDEAKGKITDNFAQKADMVIRATGGNNAGHTVVNEFGTRALHLVPVGIFNPDADCIIGPGTAVNPPSLWEEMEDVKKAGASLERLFISPKAHLTMFWHIMQDVAEEKRRGDKGKIGTTLRGIGPTYADQAARIGLRVADLQDIHAAKAKFKELFELKRKYLILMYSRSAGFTTFAEFWKDIEVYASCLAPFIRDTDKMTWDAMDAGKSILIEGAQGLILDILHGFYEGVTSTGCTLAALAQGASIDPRKIDRVIGVIRAFLTRVGTGPFPTEASQDIAAMLRERGHEYGATTGRPRRCGWLDLVLLRYAHRLCGFTEFALTKADCLAGIPEIPVGVAYSRYGQVSNSGEYATEFPMHELANFKPLYIYQNGWEEDLSLCENWGSFPQAFKDYIHLIEQFTGVFVRYVSTGPKRDQLVIR